MLKIAITPAEFNRRAGIVSTETGCAITSNQGTIAHSGVKVAYSFDGVGELTLNVLDKPFLVSSSFVENKLRNWFQA